MVFDVRHRLFLIFVALLLSGDLSCAQSPSTSADGGTPSVSTQGQALQKMQHGRSTDAIAALEKLATANPNGKGVQHDLGLAYYRAGKLVSARQAFERAIAADPDDRESIQLEGLTLYRLGRPSAAIPFLERVRTWSPNANADASHVLGLCYLNSGKLDEARGAFAAEYALPPDSGAAYLIVGRMLATSNRGCRWRTC